MKKMRKIFAMLLALTMVLGMATTVFAAPLEKDTTTKPGVTIVDLGETTNGGTITINGLSTAGNGTTLQVYKVASLGTNGNSWEVASWASGIIQKNAAGEVIIVENPATVKELQDAAGRAGIEFAEIVQVNTTTCEIQNAGVGAYIILATNTQVVYDPMIARTATYNAQGVLGFDAQSATISAKVGDYKTDKKADQGDAFIERGEEVGFTIETTFPEFEDVSAEAAPNNKFYIVDTPEGLGDLRDAMVSIAGATVTSIDIIAITAENQDNYKFTVKKEDGTTEEVTPAIGSYVFDLTPAGGIANNNDAGKRVVITYKATVESDEGYSNTANSWANGKQTGTGTMVKGYTGDITITKTDSETNAGLAGAVFNVTKGNETLQFVPVTAGQNGTYKLAKKDENGNYETGASANITSGADGKVVIKGLDQGTYHFEETVAPKGYQVVSNAVNPTTGQQHFADVTVTESTTQNVSVPGGNYTNTRLSTLPSTGGIGTTIFTIGGCIIMIVAAGLFFASRRKAAK